MENFEDVAEEVMMHDADCVMYVVMELLETDLDDFFTFPEHLKELIVEMKEKFNYWECKLDEKANQKRIIHRYGQAE